MTQQPSEQNDEMDDIERGNVRASDTPTIGTPVPLADLEGGFLKKTDQPKESEPTNQVKPSPFRKHFKKRR